MPAFWLLLFLATPFWLGCGLAMMFSFATVQGKIAALCTLLPLLALWLARWKIRWSLGAVALQTILMVGLLAVYPYPESRLVARAFPTTWDYFFNLVPESDLAELGVRLAYSGQEQSRVLGLLRPLYSEMAADPTYGHLPHVVGSTARDVLDGGPGRLHYYSYLPPGEAPRPALFFYHGAMGNFQIYLHFWKRWAEKHGWIVVCPSNGFGRWYTREGEARALALFDQALEELPIDRSRIVVVGMSNGATAATRLVNQRPEAVQGLLLVCPVLEVSQTSTDTFTEWTRAHASPIVLQGSDDRNVPSDIVRTSVEALLEAGGRCDYRLLRGHDHHILFSAWAESYRAATQLSETASAQASSAKLPSDALPNRDLRPEQRGHHARRQPKAP